MVNVYDVPPGRLIERAAKKLQEMDEIPPPPEWSKFVKTGVHKQRAPINKDWWYYRMASVLRKVYVGGPIGIARLRAEYSGKRDRGSKPYHARAGGGAIVRRIMQDLEKAGFIATVEKRGRVITPKGQKFLDNTAYEVYKELVEENKELLKY
ncbi:MAG: 30S ribosomal protein S19e [Thermoplasmata archaeon]|nr:MAG: 30S ribosomal protein S19e [Thermoplasmata archaeon]